MIPKIIHQCWIGPHKKPERLMKTWKEMNPTWQYVEWDNKKVSDFKLVNQKHFDAYDSIQQNKWNGKSNILRYEILFRYGGVWIDADTGCVNPLEDFFLDNDSFCSYENEKARTGLLAQGFLGATKENELMRLLIEELSKKEKLNYIASWISSGPQFITDIVKKYKYDKIKVYPSYFFFPEHHTGLKYEGNGKIYARHHWGTTFGGYDKEGFGNDKIK